MVERLTGEQADHFQSAAMIWGDGDQPLAREALFEHHGAGQVEEGFVLHPSIPRLRRVA